MMPRSVLGLLLLTTFGCVAHRPVSPLESLTTATTQTKQAISPVKQVAFDDADANDNQIGTRVESTGEANEFATIETSDQNRVQFIEPVFVPDFSNVQSSSDASATLEQIDLNLPTALSMVAGDHPAVGLARWRVQEAYADLAAAEVLWLPSIQAGLAFHRHDGHYQASNGDIVDVNRNSFQFGLGTSATGAGTTPRPGLVANFHLADAIFQPSIARTTAYARGHTANAVLNEQLRNAGVGYVDLVAAHQAIRIVEETQQRTRLLAKITTDFDEAGEGLKSDSQRMQTEVQLLDARIVQAKQSAAIASSRLAQTLSLDAPSQLMPLDSFVVPIDLVDATDEPFSLVQSGLQMRPELKASQALVAAACEAYQREKLAPMVPSVLLGFSNSGFGGGLGNNLDNVDGRYDLDAALSWQLRNLGLGDRAQRRRASARIQQAKFEKIRVMDAVAQEITEAASRVRFASERITMTEQAISSSQRSYELNLSRIKDGEGLPIEVLQSIQAIESASQAYLEAVTDHNRAQLQLQWALGFPINS